MSPDRMDIKRRECLIVTPTYNEKENIRALVDDIEKHSPGICDILFVDDNSPDGTGDAIEALRQEAGNIFALHRPKKSGLGSAYLEGFQYALKCGYSYIFEMDADLSHDPRYLKQMREKLEYFDLVAGSRFMGELRNINTTLPRILNSLAASAYMRLILGLECSDPMTGFVGWRRRVLESLDYSSFMAKGYFFQAEIKYESRIRGFKSVEIPIVFRNRQAGCSKMSRRDVLEALWLPWKIKFFKKKGI